MMHVYFDHNASTPLDARVLEAMLPFLREQCGNASSRSKMMDTLIDGITISPSLPAESMAGS